MKPPQEIHERGGWRRPTVHDPASLPCTHGYVDRFEELEPRDWVEEPALRRKSIRVCVPGRRCRQCGAVRLDDPSMAILVDAVFRDPRPINSSLTVRIEPAPGAGQAPRPSPPAAAQHSSGDVTEDAWAVRPAQYSLEDCILPASTRVQLREALHKVEHHDLIYKAWGFEKVDRVGRSLTLAFYGPPGTGKTRTAEGMAGELGRPFLPVDAGQIESRYMGDSAKNLRALFRAAKAANAVLFFDEADSLFGRRASNVSQGVDHEVNVLKSTLLVETERFDGVLVLATNFERNLDPAFRRRIAWSVEFLLPDEETRRRLWEYHLVPSIPLGEPRESLIAYAAFESDGLAGGDILMVMRLALAKVVAEAGAAGRLGRSHIQLALAEIRQAMSRMGSSNRSADIGAIRSLVAGTSSSD